MQIIYFVFQILFNREYNFIFREFGIMSWICRQVGNYLMCQTSRLFGGYVEALTKVVRMHDLVSSILEADGRVWTFKSCIFLKFYQVWILKIFSNFNLLFDHDHLDYLIIKISNREKTNGAYFAATLYAGLRFWIWILDILVFIFEIVIHPRTSSVSSCNWELTICGILVEQLSSRSSTWSWSVT